LRSQYKLLQVYNPMPPLKARLMNGKFILSFLPFLRNIPAFICPDFVL